MEHVLKIYILTIISHPNSSPISPNNRLNTWRSSITVRHLPPHHGHYLRPEYPFDFTQLPTRICLGDFINLIDQQNCNRVNQILFNQMLCPILQISASRSSPIFRALPENVISHVDRHNTHKGATHTVLASVSSISTVKTEDFQSSFLRSIYRPGKPVVIYQL